MSMHELRQMTSLDEDIEVLRLQPVLEAAGYKPKPVPGQDDKGSPDDSVRTEVPVRQEGAGEDDYGATKATPEPTTKAPPKAAPKGPAAGGDDADADHDEAGEAGGPGHAEPDADDVKEAVEHVLAMSEEDIDALDEDELDGVYGILVALESMTEDSSPKLEAAYGVLDAYYGHLAESSDEPIDPDALLGVVEAMEAVLADAGLISEMGGMAGNLARHSARAMAKGNALPSTAIPKAGKAEQAKVLLGKAAGFKAGLETSMPMTIPGVKGKAEAAGDDQGELSLGELVGNLTALREAVRNGDTLEQEGLGEMQEGLRAISDTATTWMEAIAAEVKAGLAEGAAVDGTDPRVQIGRHLDQIAEDARLVSAPGFTAEQYEFNLRNLAADLDDTVAIMRTVA